MIIIYASKLSLSKKLIEVFKENNLFPNQKILFIHSLYFTNIKHTFPNNIHLSQLPHSFNPDFKINQFEKWNPVIYENYELLPIEKYNNWNFSILNNANKIIFCGDCGSFDTFYFSVFIEKFNISHDKIFSPKKILTLDLPSLIENFKEEFDFFSYFSKEIEYGKIRDYFNYQFNLHSLVILGSILRKFNKDTQKYFMSKYMLQLLYFISQSEPKTEGSLCSAMHNWKGTGKYASSNKWVTSLGSSASMSDIITNLLDLNFIQKNSNNKKLYLTFEGTEFLNLLPKDCQDLDLPFRLDNWCNLNYEEVKPKIDYYIYHYFRKIKKVI